MAKRAREADEFKKKKRARLRLRKLIRSVALNRIWLEDSVDQKLSLNVKKNIALLVRTQRKIGLLTMAEKSLIRTHYSMRTVEEKKKLVTLMAGLNCFNKFPPKIRARLSKCVKFMVISPGRILIKEGHTPLMVYFVLSGEVEVSKSVFDHIQNCWVNRVEKICGSGDCLGDVELIEKTKRRHTYTTTKLVELLIVFEEDFDEVLRPVMEQQWIEKKEAIMALDYFKFFTRDQIMSACKLCELRQFEPLETICYEDKGRLSYVHFVISGECMVLQCLKILLVRHKSGSKTLELSNITKEDSSSVFKNMSNIELLKIMKAENTNVTKTIYNVDELIASDDNDSTEQTTKDDNMEIDIKNLEIRCGLAKSEENATDKSDIGASEEHRLKEDADKRQHDVFHFQIAKDKKSNADERNVIINNVRKTIRQTLLGNNSSSERFIQKRATLKTENHFIDVGSITFGGIFGLGEKLEHRVIMARTTVQCVMIPRFWLLEKEQNPGNVWQRRRFYLDTTIPSRQTLFKDFLNTRQWQKFKSNLIQSNLNPDSISNPTHVQDIPVICRIVEAHDE